jgi:glutamate-5-semialdehyde dehydrogenase
MVDSILEQIRAVKAASYKLAPLDDASRNLVLESLAEQLIAKTTWIVAENAKDLASMYSTDPRYDRLLLTKERILAIAQDVRTVALLPSPLGTILEERNRPNQLEIKKIVVPLGVVAIIYEVAKKRNTVMQLLFILLLRYLPNIRLLPLPFT